MQMAKEVLGGVHRFYIPSTGDTGYFTGPEIAEIRQDNMIEAG